LRAQLHELQLRTGNATPDLAMLLQLINAHYQTLESERRGIAESMRLMADEARSLAREAHAQSSGPCRSFSITSRTWCSRSMRRV